MLQIFILKYTILRKSWVNNLKYINFECNQYLPIIRITRFSYFQYLLIIFRHQKFKEYIK